MQKLYFSNTPNLIQIYNNKKYILIKAYFKKKYGNKPYAQALLFEDNTVLLLKDSIIQPVKNSLKEHDKNTYRLKLGLPIDKEYILNKNIICNSVSFAYTVLYGKNSNGWTSWLNDYEQPIDIYRTRSNYIMEYPKIEQGNTFENLKHFIYLTNTLGKPSKEHLHWFCDQFSDIIGNFSNFTDNDYKQLIDLFNNIKQEGKAEYQENFGGIDFYYTLGKKFGNAVDIEELENYINNLSENSIKHYEFNNTTTADEEVNRVEDAENAVRESASNIYKRVQEQVFGSFRPVVLEKQDITEHNKPGDHWFIDNTPDLVEEDNKGRYVWIHMTYKNHTEEIKLYENDYKLVRGHYINDSLNKIGNAIVKEVTNGGSTLQAGIYEKWFNKNNISIRIYKTKGINENNINESEVNYEVDINTSDDELQAIELQFSNNILNEKYIDNHNLNNKDNIKAITKDKTTEIIIDLAKNTIRIIKGKISDITDILNNADDYELEDSERYFKFKRIFK